MFSIVTVPFYISTSNALEFQFFHLPSTFAVFCLLVVAALMGKRLSLYFEINLNADDWMLISAFEVNLLKIYCFKGT